MSRICRTAAFASLRFNRVLPASHGESNLNTLRDGRRVPCTIITE